MMDQIAEAKRPLERFLRRQEVERATGLGRSTIYDLMAGSDFPKSVALTGGSVGWLESEIAAWQAKRIAARDTGTAKRHPAGPGKRNIETAVVPA
jgi:prophage regulatory protein